MDGLTITYDSKDLRFKIPFGAVRPGTPVRFSITVKGAEDDASAVLEVSAPDLRLPILMKRASTGASGTSFSAVFVPQKAGLAWYWFSLRSGGREVFVGAPDSDSATSRTVQHHPKPFQLTVYDEQRMPAWAGDGIFYHAFVDRFRKGGDGIPKLKPGSLLHTCWDDKPLYVRGCKDSSIKRWTFFGGNLEGVIEKLPYLWEMGANAIYLSPIFETSSNHKYDTADYSRIDPGFGDEETLRRLCRKASEWGIRIILDGVFSHTGSDSIYFNKEGSYEGIGAYQSVSSPFFPWYRFKSHPKEYESWWGFDTLPNVNELEPSYIDYIVEAENSIVRKWMRAGVSGWRLDVADELPDEFIKRLRKVVTEENPEAMLIGEVWDDASNKVSYSVRREYLLGHELDSVTGYPMRDAVLSYVMGRRDAAGFKKFLETMMENYPPEHMRCNLNIIGSHDVARPLTLLGGAPDESTLSPEDKETYELPASSLELGKRRMMLAGLLQYLLPGIPMLYYGDEAGAQGYSDPFNRGPFPWGREDKALKAWFKSLGEARAAHEALRSGDFRILSAEGGCLAFIRRHDRDVVLAAVNTGRDPVSLTLETGISGNEEVLFQDLFFGPYSAVATNGKIELSIGPESSVALTACLKSEPLLPTLAMERSAGVLMHVTSLPSRYGIGDFGPEAHSFVELLASSSQKLWQVLPMNPPSLGNSPYMCFSAMAGNPLMINPDYLSEEGLLSASDIETAPVFPADAVDFERVKEYKSRLFKRAFARFMARGADPSFEDFKRRNSDWLQDFSLFMVLKDMNSGRPWQDWAEEVKARDPRALQSIRSDHEAECSYHEFLQYEYDKQWKALKEHANSSGLKIIGDMAIYVSGDSSDVWANQGFFSLDADGRPLLVSGVPPDSFSATGQLWGHPVYRWDKLAADGYRWWQMRMSKSFEDFDYTRIDHFRGFAGYYAVPGGHGTAEHGRWLEGPGLNLFKAIAAGRSSLPIIVEDLGVITPDVVDLREALGFPGMRILQFMDDVPQEPDHPDRHWVAYTGTHDNETLLQRYRSLNSLPQDRRPADEHEARYVDMMLRRLYASPYDWAIVPLQDVLLLGSEARMNTPATAEGNWGWRVESKYLDEALSDKLKGLSGFGRR